MTAFRLSGRWLRLLMAAASLENEEETAGRPRETLEWEAGKILEQYGNSLLRFAYSYCANYADAQDIVQETLIAYVHKSPAFFSEDTRKAWLMQVCANKAKNKLRWQKHHPSSSLDLLYERDLKNDPDLGYVWKAVQSLPEKERSVIHLYYQEGYTCMEIASILKQKESTIRSRLSRGREKLKKILQEEYDFD